MLIRREFTVTSDASSVLAAFWSVAGIYDGFDGFRSDLGKPVVAAGGKFRAQVFFMEGWTLPDGSTRVRLTSGESELSDEIASAMAALVDELTPAELSLFKASQLNPSGFTYSVNHRFEDDDHVYEYVMPEGLREARDAHSSAIMDDRGRTVAKWDDAGVNAGAVCLARGSLFVGKRAFGVPGTCPVQLPGRSSAVDLVGLDGVLRLPNLTDAQTIATNSTGSMVATIERPGIVVLYDLSAGVQRVLTKLRQWYGGESLTFSPCGRYLLASRWGRSEVFDLANGIGYALAGSGGMYAWRVEGGSSGLLRIGRGTGDELDPGYVGTVDMATGTVHHVGQVVFPEPHFPALRRLLTHPEVGPDGRVLVGSSLGASLEYQEKNGSRDRVAILDLDSFEVTPIGPAFLDDAQVAEITHSQWRWVSPLPVAEMQDLHPSLIDEELPFAQVTVEPDPYAGELLLEVDFTSELFA